MKLSLTQYVLIVIVFSITAFLITPIFRRVAIKLKILDYPGGRKIQANPVAYLGGLAIITPITLYSSILIFSSISLDTKQQIYLGLIIPSLMIAFVGLLDDIYQLPPWPRFISQTSVGIITSFMLYLSEAGVQIFNNQLLNSVATIFWVVVIINALNFIDNMDGLATNISIIASCLGFLFWNKKPASIYLGDAGALYLGFLLAAISIRIDFESNSVPVRVIVLLLIFIIPLFDTSQVIVSRLLKAKSPFQGGRDHISHIMLNYGLSERLVLGLLTSFAIIFSMFATILILI